MLNAIKPGTATAIATDRAADDGDEEASEMGERTTDRGQVADQASNREPGHLLWLQGLLISRSVLFTGLRVGQVVGRDRRHAAHG
jgi:hypothetical protein